MAASPPSGLPLRERKKQLTRQAILREAERLFEARGYDQVTVAEIAEAANISVKTLFSYFRSKEELAFADTTLLEALLLALRERGRTSPLAAAAKCLKELITVPEQGANLETYHRGYGESAALQSGLLRMWQDYEDRITAELAGQAGAIPEQRWQAVQIVGLLRTITSTEWRFTLQHQSTEEATRKLTDWLDTVATGKGML